MKTHPTANEWLILSKMLDKVCKANNVSEHELIVTKSRKTEVMNAKFMFCYQSYRAYHISAPKIGYFLDLDHSTVLNAIARHYEIIETKSAIQASYIKSYEEFTHCGCQACESLKNKKSA